MSDLGSLLMPTLPCSVEGPQKFVADPFVTFLVTASNMLSLGFTYQVLEFLKHIKMCFSPYAPAWEGELATQLAIQTTLLPRTEDPQSPLPHIYCQEMPKKCLSHGKLGQHRAMPYAMYHTFYKWAHLILSTILWVVISHLFTGEHVSLQGRLDKLLKIP